jgi:hypothetical protein
MQKKKGLGSTRQPRRGWGAKDRERKQNKPTQKKKPTLLAKKFKDLSIRRNINIVGEEESLHERLARHQL